MPDNVNENSQENSTESATRGEERRYLEDSLDIFNFDDGVRRTRVFGKVPQNCVMLRINRFTDNYRVVGSGWKWWNGLHNRTRIYKIGIQTVNFKPNTNIRTRDNFTIPFIDFMMNIKLVDSKLYERNDFNQPHDQRVLHKLNLLVESLVNTYINSNDLSDIIQNFGNSRDIISIIDPNNELRDFCNTFGVQVLKISLQKFVQPQELVAIAEAEAKAREEEIARQTRRENIEAEGAANAQAASDFAKAIAKAKKAGASDEAIQEMVRMHNLGRLPENANVFVNLGNGASGTQGIDPAQLATAAIVAQRAIQGNNAGQPVQQAPVDPQQPQQTAVPNVNTARLTLLRQTLEQTLNTLRANQQTSAQVYIDYSNVLSRLDSGDSVIIRT